MARPERIRLGDLLIQEQLISQDQLEQALAAAGVVTLALVAGVGGGVLGANLADDDTPAAGGERMAMTVPVRSWIRLRFRRRMS